MTIRPALGLFAPFKATNGGARDRYDVHQHVQLRRCYAVHGSVAWLMGTLTSGRYTSHGSYPKYWLTSDGATLSYATVRDNIGAVARACRDGSNDGWRVVACDVNWEDRDMYCEHSGERIASAYAEPDSDE